MIAILNEKIEELEAKVAKKRELLDKDIIALNALIDVRRAHEDSKPPAKKAASRRKPEKPAEEPSDPANFND
jgi:DNA-binding protein H-NS